MCSQADEKPAELKKEKSGRCSFRSGEDIFFDVQELRETARIANLPCFANRGGGADGRTYSPPETLRTEEQGSKTKNRQNIGRLT